jgi:hypothetical protein
MHRYLGNPATRRIKHDTIAGTHYTFPVHLYSFKAKITCQPCNNNFVSQFDDKASPMLKQMLSGKLTDRLDADAQLMLARWAMKTALLIPLFVVPKAKLQHLSWPYSEFRNFRQSGMPPGNRVQIFIAQYDGYMDVSAYFRRDFSTAPPDASDPRGTEVENYWATFGVKNLIFHAWGVTQPGWGVGSLPGAFAPFLLPLWPPMRGRVLDWPPGQTLDNIGLLRLQRIGQYEPVRFLAPEINYRTTTPRPPSNS